MKPERLDPRWLAALGVFSAGILLSEVNILSSRHHVRWDVSTNSRYTLSEPTLRLLRGLEEPIVIYRIERGESADAVELRQTLESYRQASRHVRLLSIDPDRNPVKYLALLRQLDPGSDAVATDFASDAALVIESPARSWMIRASQLTALDDEGRPKLNFEGAITNAIAQTLVADEKRVCFVTGHGELSLDDESDEGLADLRRELTSANLSVLRAPMDVPEPSRQLEGCDALVVAGPERPFSDEHARVFLEAAKNAAAVFVFLDPIVDAEARVVPVGGASWASLLGGMTQPAFVLEEDPAARLPGSMGEVFFARTSVHPMTQGLSTDASRMDARVLLTTASPIELTAESEAQVILTSSERARSISNLKNGSAHAEKSGQKFDLAVAQVSTRSGREQKTVLVGSSSPLRNASFRDPARYGNRVFAENVFSWGLSNKTLISVPSRPALGAGLSLSEESLGALLRYVLLYLPLAALSMGAFLLLRRRRNEDRSRAKEES